MDRLRDGDGLPLLLGHALPASQTARDFLTLFDDPALPLLGSDGSLVHSESQGLRAQARASGAVVADLHLRAPATVATIDLDVTVLVSSRRAASFACDGRRGYQLVIALWAEQDNRRVKEVALATLPAGVELYLHADWAL